MTWSQRGAQAARDLVVDMAKSTPGMWATATEAARWYLQNSGGEDIQLRYLREERAEGLDAVRWAIRELFSGMDHGDLWELAAVAVAEAELLLGFRAELRHLAGLGAKA